MTTAKDIFDEDVKYSAIGIKPSGKIMHVDIGPITAAKEALLKTWDWVETIFLVIVKLFQGKVSIKEVGGPIMIGQAAGEIVQHDIGKLIPFMAMISVNLGIINLLPIPILDGGVILFLLLELVMRRPVSIDKREFAMKVGLALLFLLMIVVFYNDFTRPPFPK